MTKVRRASAFRRYVAASTLVAACALSLAPWCERTARAEASLGDKAAAQSLFDEGRRLMGEAKYADACPKLAESQKLDPGVGTQFHLADCYEHLGQTRERVGGLSRGGLERQIARSGRSRKGGASAGVVAGPQVVEAHHHIDCRACPRARDSSRWRFDRAPSVGNADRRRPRNSHD